MSEKLTARERYEADKARLAAKQEALNAERAAQKDASRATREQIAADYRAGTEAANNELHTSISQSKTELKKTWSDYAADRRARKEAKESKRAQK
jgi:hypothetical protein